MTLDFNTAEQQFDGVSSDFTPIPEGTIVDVLLTVRPGGVGPGGVLKQSQRSDAQYLDCEFTVTDGEYARRKFWGNLTLIGGSLNDQGLSKAGIISGRTIRAMLESCYNIQPKDMGEEAKAARTLNSYMDLNNLLIKVLVAVETYNEKDNNRLDKVITPGMPDYKQPLSPDGTVKAKVSVATHGQTESQPSPTTTSGTQSGGEKPAEMKPGWA